MINLKGFVTRDDFVIPSSKITSPIYELSDRGMTYSKDRSDHYYSVDPRYSLKVFKTEENDTMSNEQVDAVIGVIIAFNEFLPSVTNINQENTVALFTAAYNDLHPSMPIYGFTFNNLIEHNQVRVPNYVSFVIGDVGASIWLSAPLFETFYPDYDIDIVLPFDRFEFIINNPSEFVSHLNDFDVIVMNDRIDSAKSMNPSTTTRILNIPYKVGNSTVTKACYFGFNIYGAQGNYEHILKLELYRYLTEDLGIPPLVVESSFPTLLNVNEFFVIPRWDNIAIPASTGLGSINSQIVSAYNADFDVAKFIKGHNDLTFFKENTYIVPLDFNNLNLHIVNGLHSDFSVKDFKTYYSDFISVPTVHPDFSRMKQKTQRLITLLENMISVATSTDPTDLFNRVQRNKNYNFSVISRSGIVYVSYLYEDHQIYIIPRYEFLINK